MTSPFDDDRLCSAKSALVEIRPDEQGRYEFELWIQYTRKGFTSLQVGDLVAVENYIHQTDDLPTYSVLTLTQVYPEHFAAQGGEAYPSHVFESMKTVREEWVTQSEKPRYPTTTIKALAVSTGWQFIYDVRQQQLPILSEEESLPMTGGDVRPLNRDMVDAIINHGVPNTPSPFRHKEFENLQIRLDKEAFLTTHFGVFGFTGVGKSNLVSSLVTDLLSTSEGDRRCNVVLIDPNDEYLGLLIDKFVTNSNEIRYIHVGTDSLPDPILRELGSTTISQAAVDLLFRQMKLPSVLKHACQNDVGIRNFVHLGIRNALLQSRIVLPATTLASWIKNSIREQTDSRCGPAVRGILLEITGQCEDQFDQPITLIAVQQAIDFIGDDNRSRSPIRNLINTFPEPDTSRGTAHGVANRVHRALIRLRTDLNNIPDAAFISIENLIAELNNQNSQQTLVITARRDSDLKNFTSLLGNELYDFRRRGGILTPFTVFVLDEADLFIPLDDKGDEGTKNIKELSVTLARRGRKFGLGLGISTQRAALLDTEVMGNLHTYLVSKLPRSGDRQRVAEAFGIGEEQLAPTFTFRPGNWLVVSHDATGLKGVPIPSVANDANARIINAARTWISTQHTPG